MEHSVQWKEGRRRDIFWYAQATPPLPATFLTRSLGGMIVKLSCDPSPSWRFAQPTSLNEQSTFLMPTPEKQKSTWNKNIRPPWPWTNSTEKIPSTSHLPLVLHVLCAKHHTVSENSEMTGTDFTTVMCHLKLLPVTFLSCPKLLQPRCFISATLVSAFCRVSSQEDARPHGPWQTCKCNARSDYNQHRNEHSPFVCWVDCAKVRSAAPQKVQSPHQCPIIMPSAFVSPMPPHRFPEHFFRMNYLHTSSCPICIAFKQKREQPSCSLATTSPVGWFQWTGIDSLREIQQRDPQLPAAWLLGQLD